MPRDVLSALKLFTSRGRYQKFKKRYNIDATKKISGQKERKKRASAKKNVKHITKALKRQSVTVLCGNTTVNALTP